MYEISLITGGLKKHISKNRLTNVSQCLIQFNDVLRGSPIAIHSVNHDKDVQRRVRVLFSLSKLHLLLAFAHFLPLPLPTPDVSSGATMTLHSHFILVQVIHLSRHSNRLKCTEKRTFSFHPGVGGFVCIRVAPIQHLYVDILTSLSGWHWTLLLLWGRKEGSVKIHRNDLDGIIPNFLAHWAIIYNSHGKLLVD